MLLVLAIKNKARRRKETSVAQTDLLNETQPITVKVWLPGTHPGSHQAAVTLENLAGLRYFLSTLIYGNYLLSERQFDMVAYRGQQQIGQAIYLSTLALDLVEPMKLEVIFEEGEIEGIVRQIWKELQKEARRQRSEKVGEDQEN
jgi:hypothetical protein